MLIKKKAPTLAEELHKPIRRKFEKRRVLVNGIDRIWAADLVDMQAFSKFNRGIKYLLAVIDVFSKYGWLIPLKDKTGKSVASALKTIFKERKPEKMWVDKGKEFYNKDVKELIDYIPLRMRKNLVWLKGGLERSKKRCGNILRLILQTFTSINYRISSKNIIIPTILLLR